MAPVALTKSEDAFNRLADLDLGDVDAARAIQFQLLPLLKKQANDPALRVALAQACQIVGEREQALEHLAAADALWTVGGLATQVRIARLWWAFARKEKALLRARALLKPTDATVLPTVLRNNALAAALIGDVYFLEQLVKIEMETEFLQFSNVILRALDDLSLKFYFTIIQDVLLSTIQDYSMDVMFGVPFHPDDGRPFLLWTVYFDGSAIHRHDLEDRIEERLDQFFLGLSPPCSDWWWRYSVILTEAPRLASIPPAKRSRVTA